MPSAICSSDYPYFYPNPIAFNQAGLPISHHLPLSTSHIFIHNDADPKANNHVTSIPNRRGRNVPCGDHHIWTETRWILALFHRSRYESFTNRSEEDWVVGGYDYGATDILIFLLWRPSLDAKHPGERPESRYCATQAIPMPYTRLETCFREAHPSFSHAWSFRLRALSYSTGGIFGQIIIGDFFLFDRQLLSAFVWSLCRLST